MKTLVRMISIALITLLLSVPSLGAQYLSLEQEDAIQRADLIVHGTVVETTGKWVTDERGRHIYTYATLDCFEYLRGSGGDEIVVEFAGGTVGEITEYVSHSVSAKVGEEVVLFLDKDRLRPAAGIHSKYIITKGKALGARGYIGLEELRSRVKGLVLNSWDGWSGSDYLEDMLSDTIESTDTQLTVLEASDQGIAARSQAQTLTSSLEPSEVIYDNTAFEGLWFHPGAGYVLLDFGTSEGGLVTEFTIGYCTRISDPGTITVGFNTGTTSSTRGSEIAKWFFPGAPGSSDGNTACFSVFYSIPEPQQFDLPSGAFGYFYEFDNADTGAAVASGGIGNVDALWVNSDYIESPFGGDPHGGFYIKIHAVLVPDRPTIDSITPPSAPAGTGTPVTITGTNFGDVQGTGKIEFFYRTGQLKISAPVISWSDTSIVCTVPLGTDPITNQLISASSGPVTVTNHNGKTSDVYPFIVTFGPGKARWSGSSPTIEFYINENAADCSGEGAAVRSAAKSWNDAGANFTFQYAGSHSRTVSSRNWTNEILWGTVESVAVARCWYGPPPLYELSECDIIFNDDYSWDTGGSTSRLDVESVALHELGHWLKLLDLYGNIGDGYNDNGKVMYGFIADGDLTRELREDDVDGIVWIYGNEVSYYCDHDNDGHIDTSRDGSCSGAGCAPGGCETTPGTDCDDTDPLVHPGALESCDNLDNDCDSGTTDGSDESWYGNSTSCGTGVCAATGSTSCVGGIEQDSCTPGSPTEEPEATCDDRLDNDCDGLTDSADGDCIPSCVDNDGDGYGLNEDPSCTNPGIDCDDGNGAINPGASDAGCNGIDENCNGTADDGYLTSSTSCGTGVCAASGQLECQSGVEVDTCVSGSPTESPEVSCPDGLDNDCDGEIDEGEDSDGDTVDNCYDNCPNIANGDQSDLDGDGIGDVCDDDDGPASFVTRFYQQCLNRDPDQAGLDYWVNSLRDRSRCGGDVAKGFVFSPEFTSLNTSNADFLTVLYRAFFDRDPDSGGYDYWLSQLNSGVSREDVLDGFISAQEFENLCKSYGISAHIVDTERTRVEAFVTRFYQQCLSRSPDQAGLDSWVNALLDWTLTGADVAWGFVFSQEFLDLNTTNEDYLTVLYTAFFARDPDSGGYNYWLDQLANGTSREDVLNGFIYAQEFVDLCDAYGITPF